MKKIIALVLALVMAFALCACGESAAPAPASSAGSAESGKVINIYSWNDEFRNRLEAVYPEVKETSKDGTVTTLKDGTEYPADVEVEAPETVTVPANGTVDVTVKIKLTDATKEYLDGLYPNGAYIEGFIVLENEAGVDKRDGEEEEPIDYTDNEFDPVARPLTAAEKALYLPVFQQMFRPFTLREMEDVHYCAYVWYNGTDAPYCY